MSSANVCGIFAASGENPWKEIMSSDPDRPWRRNITSADMARLSLNKRRLLDKSDPRYAIQYMRLKLHSRQARSSRSVDSAQSSLYDADEHDIEWYRDPAHRWSRKRYCSFWPHQHNIRLEHHANTLRFPEANKPSHLDDSMSPEDFSPRDATFDGSGWQRRSITRGGEYSPNSRTGRLETSTSSKNASVDFSSMFDSSCYNEDDDFSVGLATSIRGSRGYRLREGVLPPQTAPSATSGRTLRVSRNVHFRGSYVNNRTRPTASRFNAPGFDFGRAYDNAGILGYRAGAYPSPRKADGSPTHVPRDETSSSSIKNKNVSGHEWRRKRGNFFERRTNVVDHSYNGFWPEDWSPVGKIARLQKVRKELAFRQEERRRADQALWEKTLRRLQETRTYDDFHSSKFYSRPNEPIAAQKTLHRQLTEPARLAKEPLFTAEYEN
ncbi:unnamed protein product [Amoebophrya sp. A25]|nr:unnamed protein product [Amoebophrya sp. A25]|eukprot:GSA25T00010985001.1